MLLDRIDEGADRTGRKPFGFTPFLNGVFGTLFLRPWLDAVSVPSIVRGYFPLSRAWAAAEVAETSVEAFRSEVEAADLPGRMIELALNLTLTRAKANRRASEDWLSTFFSDASPSQEELAEAEDHREHAAHAWMSARSFFVPLHLRRPFPPIKWMVADEAQVESRHKPRLSHPERAFPAFPQTAFKVSHAVSRAGKRVYWLAFDSRIAGGSDTAWARVIEPAGIANPPTVIFLHGISVETEFWHVDGGRIDSLIQAGFRVVRPEAPWHGRRRPRGWFGGEPAVARGPLGMLDLFQSWVGEAAALVEWARRTSSGPVALGGISLGALTAQVAASAASGWPVRQRPDALFLIATSGDFIDASLTGSLGRGLGTRTQLQSHGWTADRMKRWAPLLEPQDQPVVPPENIIMVIGTGDDVTPFSGGLALASRWALPSENLFLRSQGHFSLSLVLEHDMEPLNRLAAIIKRNR
jgi:pimeloyl-ACP methyl ester carboxylesterase